MKNKKIKSSKFTSFLFILPVIFIIVGLLLYPVCSSIFYSFTNKHLIKTRLEFVEFENYIRILSDKEFISAFLLSVKWTIASLFGQVFIGFTAALALNKIKKGSGFFRTMLIIPWAFPTIVIALSWKWLLNGVYGFLPNLILKLGFETAPSFLTESNLVFATLVFINLWFGAPLIMVNVLSALQTVASDQYEAAQIDGAQVHGNHLLLLRFHIFVLL